MTGFFKPIEDCSNTTRSKGDARIRRAIIHAKGVAIGSDGRAARKDDVVHIAAPLVRFFRAENPLVAAYQTSFRVSQIKQGQPEPVKTAGSGLPNAVIDH